MSKISFITGYIEVDGLGHGAAEFEFEVENWDELNADQRHKEFMDALWASGILDVYYKDEEVTTEEHKDE